MSMVTLNEAIRYPTHRDEWYRTIIIGGVLSIFSFLIIPILIVYGYLIRVIRARLDGKTTPPVFDEWAELLVDGVKMAIIGIVYLLIPALVAGLTIGGALLAFFTGTETGAAAGMLGLAGGFFLSSILAIIFGYVAVAAIVNFARTADIGAAFDFGTLKPILFHSDYAIAWLTAVVVMIVAGIIGGIISVIPILGFIIAAFVYFYAQVVAAGIWADGFDDAHKAVGPKGEVLGEESTA